MTAITFALLCLLEASHLIAPSLKGKRSPLQGIKRRRWGSLGAMFETAYHTQIKINVKKLRNPPSKK